MKERNFLSRRTFLRLGAGGVTAYLFGRWAAHIPGPEAEEVIPYPYPGWLETRHSPFDRPALLSLPDEGSPLLSGTAYHLRYFVLMDKTVGRAFRIAARRFAHPPTGTVRLGDLLLEHVGIAHSVLLDEFSDHGKYLAANSVHVGFMTLAALYSPYFTYKEMTNHLKIPLPFPEPKDDNLWLFSAAHGHMPHVYPAETGACTSYLDWLYRCAGDDRAVHAIHNGYLTYAAAYYHRYGIQEGRRMPNSAHAIMNLAGDPIEGAKALDTVSQHVWEAVEWWEHVRGNGTPDETGVPIPSGAFDGLQWLDFRANDRGKEVGELLARNPLTWFHVLAAARKWNDRELYRKVITGRQTAAVLPV